MGKTHGLTGLRNPCVIMAFQGWSDAADAASGVISHLVETYPSRLEMSIDGQDFYDFQVTRPHFRFVDGERQLRWPRIEVFVIEVGERDLVAVVGPEPSYHWQEFLIRVMSMLLSVRPKLVVLLGALLSDSPHTRPVPVSATASLPEVGFELGLPLSEYEGPTGILGVFANSFDHQQLASVSLWASVPHYVSEPPNPKATLALLASLEDVLNLPLDSAELIEAASEWEEQVNEVVGEDLDIAEYVATLEEHQDENTPPPTGDSIAAEFERYLRRRNRGQG